MPSQIQFPEEFLAKIRGLADAARDPSPILDHLQRIAWQDNRDGLLAGTDRDGRKFAPLAASTLRRRKGTGPPLVPMREQSRLIANYRVGSIAMGAGTAKIIGYWEDVLSKKGVPFIQFHITGTSRMPKRNPDGLRPAGMAKMSQALKDWIKGKWGGES